MIEVDAGHQYYAASLDGDKENLITYVKREGEKYPGNIGHYSGTTIQEICRVQIARLQYLYNQSSVMADYESMNEDATCIFDNRDIILRLEKRAARRHGRELKLTYTEKVNIELLPTCNKCGHIKPELHTECLVP